MSTQRKSAGKARRGMWAAIEGIVRSPGWGPTLKLLSIITAVSVAGHFSGAPEILRDLTSLVP
ncbi:hypothetical protein [Microbacterium oxydans]|uniref:hypothetical protein n=1 Tax=Microbacterium oxydans TaxID=82380 RepID=UPI000F8F98AE|nr:hypothetical protein [Microbacterium oxydans]AZS48897.1 hypothetical protein CVS53_03620 [Microbacterium oxydans]